MHMDLWFTRDRTGPSAAHSSVRERGTSDHDGTNQGQRGLSGHCVRGLNTLARWLHRRPTTSSSSPSATIFSTSQTPSKLDRTIYAFASARIVDGGTQSMPLSAAIKNSTSAEGVDGTFQHRSACVDDKLCLRASGAEVGRPAHRATELGRR